MTPHRPRTAVFIATSLDGFIARPDGTLDWLLEAQRAAPDGEDFGYAEFMETIDVLVMGRRTFETVVAFDPWPYGNTPVHVLTRQPAPDVPASIRANVSVSSESPSALLHRLGADGARRVYLDGGELIQSFMRDELVDELIVTTVPVLIGEGRRLYGATPSDQCWVLASSRSWPCGFVQSHYRRG